MGRTYGERTKTIEYNLIFRGRVCAIRSRFDVETKTPDGIFYGAYGSETNNVTYDFMGFQTKLHAQV